MVDVTTMKKDNKVIIFNLTLSTKKKSKSGNHWNNNHALAKDSDKSDINCDNNGDNNENNN